MQTLDHPTVKRIERALRNSTVEGMAFGAVQGTGERFTAAYGVALGASNAQMALLSSVPGFLGALAQFNAARAVTMLGSRKRVVLLFAALSATVWAPMIAIWFLTPSHRILYLIGFVTLYAVFNGLIGPAWGSIMAEVVPGRRRGRYFGLRSRWSTFANTAAFLLAGGLLVLMKDRGVMGFALVFGLALGFRIVSVALLRTLVELPHDVKQDERVSPIAFFHHLWTTNLGRAMLYLFCINFVVNLAGPFFAPYMLRELRMDYLTFTALEVLSILAALLAVTHWGALADRVGNRRVVLVTGVLIGFVPLGWAVSQNLVYLGMVEIFTGLVWAGFNLASSNFIYDLTSPQNRTAYLGYFNAGAAIAGSLGALVGGLLIGHVPLFLGSAILGMFLLSGVLRIVVTLAFVPGVSEVRRVQRIGAAELFHIMLGGNTVHRPLSQGRLHLHHHAHSDQDDSSIAEEGTERSHRRPEKVKPTR